MLCHPRPTPARAELGSWFWSGREAGAATAGSVSDASRRYFIFTGGKSGGLGPSGGFALSSLALAVGRLRASWAGMAAGGGRAVSNAGSRRAGTSCLGAAEGLQKSRVIFRMLDLRR